MTNKESTEEREALASYFETILQDVVANAIPTRERLDEFNDPNLAFPVFPQENRGEDLRIFSEIRERRIQELGKELRVRGHRTQAYAIMHLNDPIASSEE